MKMKMKKFLAIYLSLALMLGLMPGLSQTVLADGGHIHDGVTFTAWTSTNSLPTTAGNYYLTADVTLENRWWVPEGTTNLCLNGHSIISQKVAIHVEKGNLNLYDCDTTEHKYIINDNDIGVLDENGDHSFQGGYICGKSTDNGAGICVREGKSFTMNGGTIFGCSGKSGAGVHLSNNTTFTMSGGTICGNNSNEGGGVLFPSNSTFTMSGGTICDNYSSKTGGGVWGNGTFTMTGGEISGNKSVSGGGVYILETFNLSGGSIRENEASSRAGGVYMNNASTLNLSGSPYIAGNKVGTGDSGVNSNVCMGKMPIIKIVDTLSYSTPIGVTKINVDTGAFEMGVITSGWTSKMGTNAGNCDQFFVSEYSPYVVQKEGEELKLTHLHDFTYSVNGDTITATCSIQGCPLTDSKATLTIASPKHTTYGDGKEAAAVITDVNGIQGTAKVQYQKKTGDSYGPATETAPTDAGDYKASITLGDGEDAKTACVEYSIAKADPATPTGIAAAYSQTLADVELPDGWTWTDTATTSVGDVGNHTFKANFAGNDNYNAASDVDVTMTVGKATPVISAEDKTVKINKTVSLGATVSPEVGVTWGYSSGNKSIATVSNTGVVTGVAGGSTTITITATATDAKNCNNAQSKTINVTVLDKKPQTITASDVTLTYGDKNKSVSATTDGTGEISYAVKEGGDVIEVDSSSGVLKIKKVGTAIVTVTAAATTGDGPDEIDYAQATKDVAVNVNPKTLTITAKDQNIIVGGEVPDLAKPIWGTHYSVSGLVGSETIITPPMLAYQENGVAAGPNNTVAGIYDIVPSGADAGENYSINYVNGTLTISEKEPAEVTKAPAAKALTYNGSAQELVTEGSVTGGTIYYALGEDAVMAPAFDGRSEEENKKWNTSIPTATKAGTYYVWYKAVGDETHVDSDAECVTSKILADISKTVTFKVVNGSWDEGDSKDKVVKLEGFEGDTIKLSADKIPAVGTKPLDGYKEGSWAVVPKADTEIKVDTTYIYTYVKKDDVKPEPEPKPIVEPAPTEKTKLTVTAKDQTIAFGDSVSQASSKYTIKGLQTGDKATVTLKTDTKKYTITPVVTVKSGDKDVTDTYEIETVSGKLAIKQVPMVMAIAKGNAITATTTKINNVDGYLIYTGYCDGTAKLVKTVKGNKLVKYTYKRIAGKVLNRKKASKVIVKAYRLVDGKKVVVATSMTAYVAGALDKKFTNASAVTAAKTTVSLKKEKTTKVGAKIALAAKKKAQLSKGYAAELRYASSNKAVATVDANGKIKAVGKGTCTVYAIAVNGVKKAVKVTVK